MTGVLWLVAWIPVVMTFTRREPDRQVRLTYIALALAMAATFSTVLADVDAITRDPVVGERVVRAVLAGVAMLLVAPTIGRRVQTLLIRRFPAITALLFYTLIAGLSILYSVAPLVTAAKVFELTAGLMVVIALAVAEYPQKVVRTAIHLAISLSAVLVLMAAVGFFILPDFFRASDWRPGFIAPQAMAAPYTDENILSRLGALVTAYFAALCLQATNSKDRITKGLIAAGGALGVVLASGRQGVAMTAVSLTIVLFAIRRRFFTFWLIPIGVSMIALYGAVLYTVASRGQPWGTLETLTGRTLWWASAIEAWAEQPLLGFGFGAGGRFVALERAGAGWVSSVHSGYLEVLVGVGILGGLSLLYALYRVFRFSLRALKIEPENSVLIVPLAIGTFFSTGIGGWWSADLAVFILLAARSDLWFQPRIPAEPPDLVGSRSPGLYLGSYAP